MIISIMTKAMGLGSLGPCDDYDDYDVCVQHNCDWHEEIILLFSKL